MNPGARRPRLRASIWLIAAVGANCRLVPSSVAAADRLPGARERERDRDGAVSVRRARRGRRPRGLHRLRHRRASRRDRGPLHHPRRRGRRLPPAPGPARQHPALPRLQPGRWRASVPDLPRLARLAHPRFIKRGPSDASFADRDYDYAVITTPPDCVYPKSAILRLWPTTFQDGQLAVDQPITTAWAIPPMSGSRR